MVEIPEEAQTEALRLLAKAKKKRDAVVAREDALVRDAALAADQVGASRSRIKELAGVSSRTLYAWIAAAGRPVRPKKPSTKATNAPKSKGA
ncbi:hypothetical protein [Streptomyces gilvosporeus]|uniref:hypothetical protein n=1 Tax=Streptomyces gilvosporeus TaxID=553510 RepID=UPI0033C9481E